MIRFIDVRGQGICNRFAFWDTITGKFVEIDNEQAWDNWNDFIEVAKSYDDIGRFKKLCPQWVFNNGEDDIDAFYNA